MHGKKVKFLQKGIVCLQQFEYKLRLCIISLQERNPLQVLLLKWFSDIYKILREETRVSENLYTD
jgi:hypothetical protein